MIVKRVRERQSAWIVFYLDYFMVEMEIVKFSFKDFN